MEHTNFTGYWVENESMLKENGCTKKSAHKIWCDAITLIQHHQKNALLPAEKEKQVLDDYADWYKRTYGGVIMVNDYWIDKFSNGK